MYTILPKVFAHYKLIGFKMTFVHPMQLEQQLKLTCKFGCYLVKDATSTGQQCNIAINSPPKVFFSPHMQIS